MIIRLIKLLIGLSAIIVLMIGSIALANQRILFTPEIEFVGVDDIFEVNLAVDIGVVDLFAYTTHVKFDTNVIKIVNVNPSAEWLSLSGTDQYFVGADSNEVDPDTHLPNWYFHVVPP